MKNNLTTQPDSADAVRFTRDLIRNFGRKKSREILHILLKQAEAKDMEDMQKLMVESLVELDKHLTKQDYN